MKYSGIETTTNKQINKETRRRLKASSPTIQAQLQLSVSRLVLAPNDLST